MKATLRSALAATAFGLSAQAGAAGYPQADKPIHFIVGFPAGSTIDNVSRVVVDDIRARTGAQIIVENKPGALGVLGGHRRPAAPDGYTMMPSSSATSSSAPISRRLSSAMTRSRTSPRWASWRASTW